MALPSADWGAREICHAALPRACFVLSVADNLAVPSRQGDPLRDDARLDARADLKSSLIQARARRCPDECAGKSWYGIHAVLTSRLQRGPAPRRQPAERVGSHGAPPKPPHHGSTVIVLCCP